MGVLKIHAYQATTVNYYKNLKTNILKCYANIYFNKQCIEQKVIPAYVGIKIPRTSPASTISQRKVHITSLKDEIKFLYKKKDKNTIHNP
jgi:hypothetical protein